MKVCPKCGMQNDDNAVVCIQCGYLFGNAQPEFQQPPVYTQQPPVYTQQQPNYAQQTPTYSQPAVPKNNGFALASLILGIAGVTICCWTLIPQILAVVFGFMGKKKIEESNGLEQGQNFAKIGTILGFVGIGLCVVLWIVYILIIVGAIASGGMTKFSNNY
jgi:hypothetical protein